MNRRGFLKGLAAVVGGVALTEAIPLGRVWSFPKEISIVEPVTVRLFSCWDHAMGQMLTRVDMAYGVCSPMIPPQVELAHSWSGRNAVKEAIRENPRLEQQLRSLQTHIEAFPDRGEPGAIYGFHHRELSSLPQLRS